MDVSELKGPFVKITVVRAPRTARQLKTLVRLLGKDPVFAKANRIVTTIRKNSVIRRQQSGSIWENRPRKRRLITGRPGESGTIPLTAEVKRSLPSLGDIVTVQ